MFFVKVRVLPECASNFCRPFRGMQELPEASRIKNTRSLYTAGKIKQLTISGHQHIGIPRNRCSQYPAVICIQGQVRQCFRR